MLLNHINKIGNENIRTEIMKGLYSDAKSIPSKYFYDKEGSELFEIITGLKEYYITRTEKSILAVLSMKKEFDLSDTDIIELGSGDHSKIDILLRQIPAETIKTIRYFPIDISRDAIEAAGEYLTRSYPNLKFCGIVADFSRQTDVIPAERKNLICFFGSTIGNFTREESKKFFCKIASVMKPGDIFLLGMDMVKDAEILHGAYNDSSGITEKFNKNILKVVNDLIGTRFDPNDFEHVAFYNKTLQRVEMHLKARCDMKIYSSYTSAPVIIQEGESIHTENSHKFTEKHINELVKISGLTLSKVYTDKNNWFSLVKFIKS